MDAEWEIPFEELEFTNHLPTARGAFAEVYRGKWRKIEVAIKVFESRNSLGQAGKLGKLDKLDKLNLDKLDKEEKERLNELRILTLVHHPNIVMFLGYAKILATKICLVFEWMHGGNLFDTIHTQPFKHSYQKRISNSSLYQLQRTNESSFSEGASTSAVHEEDNNNNKDEKQHRSVGAVGTFRYMAPEIMEDVLIIDDVEWKNDSGELCKKHRTSENLDMYSLGMILYFIWEDRQPFWDWESSCPIGSQESTKERMVSFCKYVYEGNRPRFYKTPRRIQKVIRQCWHVDPSQRPNADSIVSLFEESSGTFQERCLFSVYNCAQCLCTSSL